VALLTLTVVHTRVHCILLAARNSRYKRHCTVVHAHDFDVAKWQPRCREWPTHHCLVTDALLPSNRRGEQLHVSCPTMIAEDSNDCGDAYVARCDISNTLTTRPLGTLGSCDGRTKEISRLHTLVHIIQDTVVLHNIKHTYVETCTLSLTHVSLGTH